jgi:cation transport ATPase
MFLPKFTLRQTLVWVVIAGVVSIVLAAAWQGKEWAIGHTAALVAAIAVAFLAAVSYWIFFLLGHFLTLRTKRKTATTARSAILPEETKP